MPDISRRSVIAGASGLLAMSACSAPRKRTSSRVTTFDRERFIEEVKLARGEGQKAVEEVLARAVSDPGSVVRDLGGPTGRPIDVLHHDEGLSIFRIFWPPLAVLVPHDHLMWASIGVYTGRENNILWKASRQGLSAVDAVSVATGEVLSLPPDAIHSVTNPIEAYTGALHVYGGDLSSAPRSQWDPLTLAREPFDLEDGRRILLQAEERFGGR